MARFDAPVLKAGERGAALILVMIALAALMPLALLLSVFAWRRQQQVNARQQDLAGQAATRGALDLAMGRIQSGGLVLRGPDQSERFELEEPEGRPVRVRVSRETDAVLSVDGRLLAPEDAAMADVDQLGIDNFGNQVREYRRLEIYIVEAESPARRPFGAVRLLATVVRLDTGETSCIGLRYDRGYFRTP